MTIPDKKLNALRQKITEGLRIQRDTNEPVPYMDPANVVGDVCARQNHTIFARRGCGKTLLLHHSTKALAKSKIRTVYLNCEDFKRHSFPNVLIELLDALSRIGKASHKLVWNEQEVKRLSSNYSNRTCDTARSR